MSTSLERFLEEGLAQRGRPVWARQPLIVTSAGPGWAAIDGEERLLLCSNDYLGLASDPRVVQAAHDALERFGAGSRAARSLGGDTDLHRQLERELADFKGADAALLFGSGFSLNSSVIAALTGPDDVVLSDSLNHASIVDGCRLSAAATRVYQHNDTSSLEATLRDASIAYKRMIVTDAVFSMDGELAPLPEIVRLARQYDAFLMLDDAHATGVLGPGGEGSLEHFGLHGAVPILMGTLGKALGSIGGFVVGSQDLIDFLAGSARSFLFTTSLPPAAAAAALASLRILRSEPERVARLQENARRLHSGLREQGFRLPAEAGAILPVFLDDDSAAAALSRKLYEAGIVVQPIGPPYVPRGTSRLRLIASAAHTPAEVDTVLDRFRRVAPTAAASPV
jgi:8-amino-7-oxononanoate synthase